MGKGYGLLAFCKALGNGLLNGRLDVVLADLLDNVVNGFGKVAGLDDFLSQACDLLALSGSVTPDDAGTGREQIIGGML